MSKLSKRKTLLLGLAISASSYIFLESLEPTGALKEARACAEAVREDQLNDTKNRKIITDNCSSEIAALVLGTEVKVPTDATISLGRNEAEDNLSDEVWRSHISHAIGAGIVGGVAHGFITLVSYAQRQEAQSRQDTYSQIR